MEKSVVREKYCSLREELPPEAVSAASEAVCRLLAGWPILSSADTVLTYLAFRNEIDLSALLEALRHTHWVIPRIAGRRLALHQYDPERLVRHRFGMLEPDPSLPTVDPKEIDLVLVPGTAFDCRGGRVGFGGGYYDRLLPTMRAIRVGVTYEPCLLAEVPCDAYDQRMDWIVTPEKIIHVDRGRKAGGCPAPA
jgi:5-formyltetrahydrofolate cyclo-ligase